MRFFDACDVCRYSAQYGSSITMCDATSISVKTNCDSTCTHCTQAYTLTQNTPVQIQSGATTSTRLLQSIFNCNIVKVETFSDPSCAQLISLDAYGSGFCWGANLGSLGNAYYKSTCSSRTNSSTPTVLKTPLCSETSCSNCQGNPTTFETGICTYISPANYQKWSCFNSNGYSSYQCAFWTITDYTMVTSAASSTSLPAVMVPITTPLQQTTTAPQSSSAWWSNSFPNEGVAYFVVVGVPILGLLISLAGVIVAWKTGKADVNDQASAQSAQNLPRPQTPAQQMQIPTQQFQAPPPYQWQAPMPGVPQPQYSFL